MTLQRFRKFQNLFSTILFLSVFSFFAITTKLDLTKVQLSYWGANNNFSLLWNISVVILSISFYFNYKNYVASNPRLKINNLLKLLFSLIFVSLAFTAIFNLHYTIHNIFAYFYFLAYPLGIFLIAHLNVKNILFSEWLIHLIFGFAIIFITLIFIPLNKGLAIPEIVHSSLVIGWNFFILSKSH